MGMYYNPPPNWPPPPPGWVPPPGWQPDPAWGPAPPGHQFWLDDRSTQRLAGSRYPDGTQTLGNGLAVTALILAVGSLLLCWVPIVNNVIFFGALLALVLGIAASVLTYSVPAWGRTASFASIGVALLAIAGVLVTQLFYASLFV